VTLGSQKDPCTNTILCRARLAQTVPLYARLEHRGSAKYPSAQHKQTNKATHLKNSNAIGARPRPGTAIRSLHLLVITRTVQHIACNCQISFVFSPFSPAPPLSRQAHSCSYLLWDHRSSPKLAAKYSLTINTQHAVECILSPDTRSLRPSPFSF
jgi:hypothetical protein